MHRRNLLLSISSLAASAIPVPAPAQTRWPDRPLRVVIGYPPGSMGDNLVRAMAEDLRQRLGQALVVDNRPGAGGSLASAAVARAAPDGLTLLVGAASNFTANQFLYKDLGFDPLKAFEPVALLGDVPSVLFIHAGVAASSFAEFGQAAKASNGRFAYASPGSGTPPHLAAELINRAAGWSMLHVPYKGSPPALNAVLAGDAQLLLASASGRRY